MAALEHRARRSFLTRTTGGLAALIAAGVAPVVHARRGLRNPTTETLANNRELLSDLRSQRTKLGGDWLVIHHTASSRASVKGLDNYHRNHFGDPFGAEYHFIVNNGVKGPDGAIELARWRHQVLAAHLFHPERAPNSLAICLVGNFETRGEPSGAQMLGLATLCRALQVKFDIPSEQVVTHRQVDGRLTQCPGKDFPYEDLQTVLF
jgi:N-acetyl-anhydromuramyl-L-alanine amidase AmpD